LLLPVSPGGSREFAPVYNLENLPPVKFEVYLEPELEGQSPGEYLDDRARLASSDFKVLMFRPEFSKQDGQPELGDPVAVLNRDADGVYNAADSLPEATGFYAWQVTAEFADRNGSSISLASAPLYFLISQNPQHEELLIAPRLTELLNLLRQQCSSQQRDTATLTATLRGHKPFSIYSSASDRFVCTTTSTGKAVPLPDYQQDFYPSISQMEVLGGVVIWAGELQQMVAEDGEADLINFGKAVAQELSTWDQPKGAALESAFRGLINISEDFTEESVESKRDRLSELSQLRLFADELLGCGTASICTDYEACFLTYAAKADTRLRSIEELETEIAELVGEDKAREWFRVFREIRSDLALLSVDVRRGRLSKNQLAERINSSRGTISTPAIERTYLVNGSCPVDYESLSKLIAGDPSQIASLIRELVECRLAALARVVWPEL
jgi:hypothetical protein